MSTLDFAHDIGAVSTIVGLPVPAGEVNEAVEVREMEAWERQLTSTYRVLDLNRRKTIASGLTFWQAHELIKQGKAADQQARFDIRTEIPA